MILTDVNQITEFITTLTRAEKRNTIWPSVVFERCQQFYRRTCAGMCFAMSGTY
jgi:hypothetical protein